MQARQSTDGSWVSKVVFQVVLSSDGIRDQAHNINAGSGHWMCGVCGRWSLCVQYLNGKKENELTFPPKFFTERTRENKGYCLLCTLVHIQQTYFSLVKILKNAWWKTQLVREIIYPKVWIRNRTTTGEPEKFCTYRIGHPTCFFI